ncbi:MAG: glycoside hydrolase family 172 protein [Candidatus Hodarchaeota archaeon]
MKNLRELCKITPEKQTFRLSSWDKTGKNSDFWLVKPGDACLLADIKGPAIITHIWSSWHAKWREILLKFIWDDADFPSINVPFGDFFGLGHGIVNSYQSFLFSASTNSNNQFNSGCAHNSYVQMPFRKQARIELVNQSEEEVRVWFYFDYENCTLEEIEDYGYFHAEFRREVPFGGWGHELAVNSPETDSVPNIEREAWDNNYVILETKGTGHYIGCNISITNLHDEQFPRSWWGEGDEMVWIDGYKWPPNIHGTGSEDYFNQGWGMQPNAFMRNGSSIYEHETGGYQTCYVQHLENPIRFKKEIKVTIEAGHANHLRNEISSVAYWYATEPTIVRAPPPVEKRRPIMKKDGKWIVEDRVKTTSKEVKVNEAMKKMKGEWKKKTIAPYLKELGTLIKDDEGALCLKMTFMGGDSVVLDIPLVEILEDEVGAPLLFNLFEEVLQCSISDDEGKFVLKGKDGKKIEGVDQLIEKYLGQRIKIVLSVLFDDEKEPAYPAKLKLVFTDDVNFRDRSYVFR